MSSIHNKSDSNYYKAIFKGTMLFGGVQVFQILISFLRSKITAVYLGPEGIGIMGMYTSSLAILITIATMGITASSVRYISIEKDENKRINLIKFSKKLFLILGFVGGGLTISFSHFLSMTSFQSSNYTIAYVILSLYVLFSVINSGNTSVLQGAMHTRAIASANVISSGIGLAFTFPLLYFFRLKAIIPAILLIPIISTICTYISLHKITKNDNKKLTKQYYKKNAKKFLSYGIVITMTQICMSITAYLINLIISKYGSIADLGYYQAGTNITSKCIGLVFTAMNIDYYPKLISVSENNDKMNSLINQQGVVTLLLSIPVLSVMIIVAPALIIVFLSSEFAPIKDFIQILTFGMGFKAISFCLGSVSFAKGDKKIFFVYEGIFCNIQNLILALIGYKYWGLQGIAYSFVINYILYLITVSLLCVIRYKYKPTKDIIIMIILSILSLSLIFILSRFGNGISFILEIILTSIVCVFALYQLEKRISIIEMIKNKLFKHKEAKKNE